MQGKGPFVSVFARRVCVWSACSGRVSHASIVEVGGGFVKTHVGLGWSLPPRILSCSYSRGGSAVLVLSVRRGGHVHVEPFMC